VIVRFAVIVDRARHARDAQSGARGDLPITLEKRL
jgi:hypothetical protein